MDFKFNDNWGKPGYTLKKINAKRLEINFSIHNFSLNNIIVKDKIMQKISLQGYFLPNDEGCPDLPGGGRYIAIPQGAVVSFQIISSRTEILTNIDLSPAPRIPLVSEESLPEYNKNEQVYSRNAFYPAEPVKLSAPDKIRGIDVVMLGITPFQYNPVTKELIVYKDLKIEITLKGGNGHIGDNRLRSRWWDPVLKDMLLNGASLPEINYNSISSKNNEGFEYIIITPDDPGFIAWADSIRSFRIKQGIRTGIVTISEIGGNTRYDIENYINNAYNNWDIPPSAVLLLADYGISGNAITSAHLAHTVSGGYISDNVFADINNDDLPDIAFARITAQNAIHLETMIGKFLEYERNPPENPDYYAHPVTAMGWQTSRWFQLCSEIINGFWEYGLGKNPVRENSIFSGTPGGVWSTALNTDIIVDYFGPDGLGYIPENSAHLTDWGANASRLNNDINSGAFMLQHRDHGFETGWGEPSYTNYDLPGLNNEDLTFVFSVNCLTGKFDWESECFAEAFHRHTYGALGIIAATDESYSFVNDTYVWGMYDNMWHDFMPDYGTNPDSRSIFPCFANVAGKYFLEQSSWPYNTLNKAITYYLFHYHGDAFTTVYSEMPQQLTVVHDSVLLCNQDFFTVTADSGALVALTNNGEIIAVSEATGNPENIAISTQPPITKIHLTVTKQNYFRYNCLIPVMPPDGAYVIGYSYSINDNTGNGNAQINNGESIMLSLSMKNVGNAPAENVSVYISTSDPYISITDYYENYGNIPANEIITIEDGFAFDVSDNIPDGHVVLYDVIANDGDSIWLSSFTIEGHAPVLKIGNYIVCDPLGNNNGILDPGENADIIIKTINSGSGDALNTIGILTTSGNNIVINDTINEFDTLLSGDIIYASFNLTIDTSVLIGTAIDMNYSVTSGLYSAIDSFNIAIGLIVEDWESGDFEKYNWITGGNASWTITSSDCFEGMYSAKSGYIIDQQSSYFSLDYIVAVDDSISFYRKVSSEEAWDFFEFYIDSIKIDEWSGEEDWTRESYPVSAGEHVFKWVYDKDMYVSTGQDCAWIDYIVLPPATTAYAGIDDEICEGNPYTLSGKAEYYNLLNWTSSGTGTFENNGTLTPVYTPSIDDINAGHVTLTLTAFSEYGQVSDDMILTFLYLPPQPDTPFGETILCENSPDTDYFITGMPNTIFYIWDIEPSEAGIITGISTYATVNWDNNFTGNAAIKVRGVNECGEGEYSDSLIVTVYPLPNITLEPFEDVCLNDPPFELTGGLPVGGTYSGQGVIDGYFYPAVAGIGNHIITYAYTDQNGCENFAEESIYVDNCTGIYYNSDNIGIEIFPNPNTGTFTLKIHIENLDIIDIKIINSLNEIIFEKSNVPVNKNYYDNINLDNYSKGIYYIKITGKETNYVRKIIIDL
ncbi:MAG: T9SS type A sorting domain-containing protein [Bacteroidales bacterium]|nr:T9SS type A sorting domain-containing protein [Bacteroidales bacterium]